jgi:hypothetical protein
LDVFFLSVVFFTSALATLSCQDGWEVGLSIINIVYTEYCVIEMANVTVSVPQEMKKKMDAFAVINWSEVAREAFAEQLSRMELLKAITSKSKATDKDVEEIAAKVRAGVLRRHEARG